ncbi:putative C6 transcription factor [Stipitochalara longipes BDJ]|nr:putative C6 transcription factor [Stipitochalara longipes BDJ]
MVYCGRPSKACLRCRGRKLKCDLKAPVCGQCFRAGVICTGYRDPHQLRIQNESESTRRKAISKKPVPTHKPQSLPLSLNSQARDAFFAYHVTGTSRTWDFLQPFYNPADSPEHLNLAIDAVSLAYLSQKLFSDAASLSARQRYIAALRMTSKALQFPDVAAKNTTLLATLLLDLFEKITNNEPRVIESWAGHMKGALALVELRGLDTFQDHASVRVLVRLSTNVLISCVATGSPVPKELKELRVYIAKLVDTNDPKWRLMDLMEEYIDLQADISRALLPIATAVQRSLELDAKYTNLALNVPPAWQPKTTIIEYTSDRIFEQYYDTYGDRHITQPLNVLRLIRIFINEFILDHNVEVDECILLSKTASDNIEQMGKQICASVPQYVDCFGAARYRLPCTTTEHNHTHSPNQNLDCYTLIYSLYVVARSRYCPINMKVWVIKELHYMGSHFSIRNAELVARMLEKGTECENPWAVYAMLGGYAFAA